jgi:peptidoglycan/LPS O-acetylase OafA/YrhL
VLSPYGPWVDGVYWTLPVEIAFYTVIFLALGFGLFKQPIAIFGALSVAACTYLVARLGAQHWPGSPVFVWSIAISGRSAQLILLEDGGYFALGGALWLIGARGLSVGRISVLTVSVVAGFLACALSDRAFSSVTPIVVPETIWIVATCLIMVAVWRADFLGRVLASWSRSIRFLALSTYPLYLLHDDAGMMIRDGLASVGFPSLAAVLIAASAALAGALAVTAFLEPAIRNPMRRALAHILSLGPSRAVQPATQEPV